MNNKLVLLFSFSLIAKKQTIMIKLLSITWMKWLKKFLAFSANFVIQENKSLSSKMILMMLLLSANLINLSKTWISLGSIKFKDNQKLNSPLMASKLLLLKTNFWLQREMLQFKVCYQMVILGHLSMRTLTQRRLMKSKPLRRMLLRFKMTRKRHLLRPCLMNQRFHNITQYLLKRRQFLGMQLKLFPKKILRILAYKLGLET